LKLLSWFHHPPKPPQPVPLPAPESAPELSFLEVAQPDAEPPQKPKFYSNNNSHAANPDQDKNLDTPKLNGQQTDAPRTETAHRTQIAKLAEPETKPEQQQPKPSPPQPAPKHGDLAQGKPQDAQQQNDPQPPRPRTIKQALAQKSGHIQGLQMRQDGGTHRIALRPSFDAKATPFGDYDAQLTEAIQQKWDDLLDSLNFAGDTTGRVTLHFHLNYDGTISEVTMGDRTVNMMWAYLCQQALTEPAPFAPWPEDMRRMVGGNFRDMTFTFYYY